MTPVSGDDLQLFNPLPKTSDEFLYFNRLPVEIRQMVWELALSHERLLHVYLRSRLSGSSSTENTASHSLSDRNEDHNECDIILSERQPISKIFHINAESRRTAMRFYRVHLPCQYRWNDQVEENGTLYLHPELDALNFKSWYHLADIGKRVFLHDRQHVGLVNIAINTASLEHAWPKCWLRRLGTLEQQVFSRFRRVIFIFSGGEEHMFLDRKKQTFINKHGIHHSRPIMAPITKFSRIPCDPRAIDPHLNQVLLGSIDPRLVLHRWFVSMADCGVKYSHKVDYQFLVAYGGREQGEGSFGNPLLVFRGWRKHELDINNRNEAMGWVREGERKWKWLLNLLAEEGDRTAEDAIEELGRTLESAIGFWLFPIEALGKLPRTKRKYTHYYSVLKSGRRWKHKRAVNLSKYKPELCLFHLP